MDLEEARKLALDLMSQHGLSNYHLDLSQRSLKYGNIGFCNWVRRIIVISTNYIELNSVENVRDTILHEIAHALVGKNEYRIASTGRKIRVVHGPTWLAIAKNIGCSGERCAGADTITARSLPKAPIILHEHYRYQGRCPGCHRLHFRVSEPKPTAKYCFPCSRRDRQNVIIPFADVSALSKEEREQKRLGEFAQESEYSRKKKKGNQ